MNVGIFGGAFNPIHVGHLAAAREAAEIVGLDKIVLVVSARPPHKSDEEMIDVESRYAMVALACADDPLFEPSDAEIARDGPSYTVDSMKFFKERYGESAPFIVGQDAAEDMASWKSAATFLKTTNIIVVTRPGYDPATLLDVLQSTLSVRYKNLSLVQSGKGAKGRLTTIGVVGGSTTISLVEVTPMGVSSTMIRKRVAMGRSVRYLVPDAVRSYLERKKEADAG